MTTQEQLTQYFKDNFTAYYRAHQAHVNIVGRNFVSDHKLLKGVYEDRQEQIDTIGELLRTMDEYMPCDLNEVLLDSRVDTGRLDGDSEFLLDMVRQDLEHLVESLRDLIVIAEDESYPEIANYAQDQILAMKKQIWMLRSTLS
jgi:DNA-binding ferritin-like protein